MTGVGTRAPVITKGWSAAAATGRRCVEQGAGEKLGAPTPCPSAPSSPMLPKPWAPGHPISLTSCHHHEPLSGAGPDTRWPLPLPSPRGRPRPSRPASPPEVAPVERDQEALLPVDGLVPLHAEGAATIPLIPGKAVDGDLPVPAPAALLRLEQLQGQRKALRQDPGLLAGPRRDSGRGSPPPHPPTLCIRLPGKVLVLGRGL